MLNPHFQRRLTFEPLEHRFLFAVAFAEHIILEGRIGGGRPIHSADMDNDGDLDMVFVVDSTLGTGRSVYWYENTDGRGDFEVGQEIGSAWGWNREGTYPADMDGDGDIDVLAMLPSMGTRTIVWYENADGKGAFEEAQHVVTPDAGRDLRSIYAADLDGDGDVDALSAARADDKIAWFENLGGRGMSWQEHVITTGADNVSFVYTADVDGDGDQDVLSKQHRGRWDVGSIVWYENIDGNGRFGSRQVVATSWGRDLADSLHAADLDGDGDQDLLSGNSVPPREVAWNENLDGEGDFGPAKVISTGGGRKTSVYAADLDNDGDMDVITGGNNLQWWENTDGKGRFGRPRTITPFYQTYYSIHTSDVDADGDIDVAVNALDSVAWYENLLFDPAPHPASGDANGDFQFDQTDIVHVLQTAKYLTNEPATWEQGDWNDDGVFDQLDIVAALQTGNYLQGPYAAHSVNAEWETLSEGAEHSSVEKLLARDSELDDLLSGF